MKVLFHSNAPWVPTGYGQQTALTVPRLASLGHEVAISAFYGHQGTPTEWNGHKVYPLGQHEYGCDVLPGHARHFGAELVITLMDVWKLEPERVRDLPLACWMPVDCDDGGGLQERGLSLRDHLTLRATGAVPVAVSRFGEAQLRQSGHDPLMVPHAVDTAIFRPREDRKALRQAMGVDDRFVIGMCAANSDQRNRKAWPDQLAAFAWLHRRHPDTLLFAHTVKTSKLGLNLGKLARDLGISSAVMWAKEYEAKAGLITPDMMAATMATWDLYSGCSMAEGFGIPILEAEASGVPSVVTDGSAMAEVGSGWKVPGDPWWSDLHGAWWRKPSVAGICRAYEKAYQRGPAYQAKAARAREHALEYDADRVLTEHWQPALKELEARLCGT